MKWLTVLLLSSLAFSADAAITYTPGPAKIYKVGGSFLGNYATCDAGVQAQSVPNGKTYKFRCVQITTAKAVAGGGGGTPVNCVVSAYGPWTPNGAWSACDASGNQTRTETRTRTVTTPPSNGGTACPALTETRTVSQSCTAPPPPPPPGDVLSTLLNFAETWDRNWNFEGHNVTSQFGEDQGKWDYGESVYEPWLFDRATVGYRLFQLTGNARWRTKFLSDFAYYRSHIDGQGIFTPKGADDTKYGYVTPFLLYERDTSDAQYRPIAKRIYDSWIREWSPTFYPAGQAQLWTEREIAFALEAAVSYLEMTGDSAALSRARALVAQWTHVAGSAGAPLTTYTQHEGGGAGGTTPQNLTNSPWMSALYFQAARRFAALDSASTAEVFQQASRYADWCEQADQTPGNGGDRNCYYDAAKAHPEVSGYTFPRYLTGELHSDAGYDEGNADHCVDVGGLLKFARIAKVARSESVGPVDARINQMAACADWDFGNWTRDTAYLPKYRLSPPRKFNWWLRGYYEDAQ